MSKKSDKTTGIGIKEIAITSCLLTIFYPAAAVSAEPQLIQANENLQKIFKRMKEKYSAHDAQLAQLAAQTQAAKIAPDTATSSQTFDAESTSPTLSNTSDDLYPSSDENSESRFAAGEELILSASINGLELASIIAIKSEQGLQVGIGDLFQLLEVAIYTDVENVSADGWFKKESNIFSLKQLVDNRLEVKANDKTYFVDAEDYSVADDIFIELDHLKNWFAVDYSIDEAALALALSAKEKLPVELRLARQGKSKTITTANNKSILPLQSSGYKAFSPPMLDIQASARETKQVYPPPASAPADQEPTSSRDTSGNYSILSSHDLAYLNTELFLAGNQEEALSSARLTLSRQSERGDLLGALQATEYTVGDVVPINAGIGNTRAMSRGFSFGNTPINQLADNRKVNITGELQVGWDVELYRNGVLIDQRLGVSNGRYEFNDTLLEYGNNDFELIFYGPQGQIETKTESYIVDSNTVLAGQSMYRFSLVEAGESVFNVDQTTNDLTQQGVVASTALDYGVTDWLALTAGYSNFEPKLGENQEYISLGASASLGKAGLLSARAMQDHNNLINSAYDFRTRLLNTSYSLNYQRAENFYVAPDNLTATEIINTDTYSVNMSGQLFTGTLLPISYKNSWLRSEQKELGLENEYFQNSVAIGSRLGYFSNSIVWNKDAVADPLLDPLLMQPLADSVTGGFQYRKNFGRMHTRLFSTYAIKPTKEVLSYGGIFNYNWSPSLNSELRYTYLALPDLYQVNLGLNWRKDAFYLSTNTGYNEDGSWQAGLSLRFSLGYEPQQRSVFTSAQPIAQSGAVSARVFEDLNMNGIFDANERPIENATVKAVQAYRQEKTNASGIAVLSSIYNNTTTDIIVDESTLDGPFMINATPGVAIKARKGFIDMVELPVVKAGEVDGIIYQKEKDGESNPAPYIMLNLLDKNKNIAASTRSEYDGYYLFTNVKPGNYHLKVDEEFIERRGFKTADKHLGFSSEGDVIAGVDFVLRPLDEAAGYVASAGKFESPEMLKLYYHLLRKKLGAQFIQTPFYIKHPNKGGYELGLAYFAGVPKAGSDAERKANQACIGLSKYKIQCEVQYQDFKY